MCVGGRGGGGGVENVTAPPEERDEAFDFVRMYQHEKYHYYRIIQQNVFLPMKHFLKVFCVSGPCKKKIHERIIIITADLI